MTSRSTLARLVLCWLVAVPPTAAFAVPPPATGSAAAVADAAGRAATGITVDGLMRDIRALSADAMEGRAPGTPGGEKAVAYLVERFRASGLAPGNPDGSYVQSVPMIAYQPAPEGRFTVGDRRIGLAYPDDYVAVSRRGVAEIAVAGSQIVFVGYGVIAPEVGWDDFKGLDLRGKTLLMLVGDPPVPDPADPADPTRLDPATFKGEAMTYYGRWTYKYEVAARLGAAAAILVHETGPAGYPWSVVQGSWTGEGFGLDTPEALAAHAPVESWVTLEKARELLAACGTSFDALKSSARARDFRPVPLPATASFTVRSAIRRFASQNVVARLAGSDAAGRDEAVLYSAHWDHLGRRPGGGDDDTIVNGALDNGSGMATLLAIAESFTRLPRPPRRSLLFLSSTGEESGLIGAAHFAAHPVWPLARLLAVVNMDMMNVWGRARAVVSIGHGMSTLDEILAAEAARQGRIVLPDPEPEKGYFYRSDHFELAKRGVPALHFLHPGAEYRDRPADFGRRLRDRYTAEDYHRPSDDVKDDWDLAGTVEDARLLFAVGLALADSVEVPAWKPGSEFRGIREAIRAERDAGRPTPPVSGGGRP